MLDIFNNVWIILISCVLLICIVKKIYYINEPFNEIKFIEQYQNKEKLKQRISIEVLQKSLPTLASYYVGLH